MKQASREAKAWWDRIANYLGMEVSEWHYKDWAHFRYPGRDGRRPMSGINGEIVHSLLDRIEELERQVTLQGEAPHG